MKSKFNKKITLILLQSTAYHMINQEDEIVTFYLVK